MNLARFVASSFLVERMAIRNHHRLPRSPHPRALCLGAYLAGGFVLLRTPQSCMVGDYVLWRTIGAANLGSAYVVLLR